MDPQADVHPLVYSPRPIDHHPPSQRTESQSSSERTDAKQTVAGLQLGWASPSATQRVRAGGGEFREFYDRLRVSPAMSSAQKPISPC